MLDSYFDQLRSKIMAQRAESPPPDLAAMRAGTAIETEALGPGPLLAKVETLPLQTRAGERALRQFIPQAPQGIILFTHGGGWAIGSLDDFDSLARAFAKLSGCIVVMPDYRLAPEHPFPAGLEDVIDALLWAQDQAKSLQLPLLAMGDSAGANLTLAAALELGESLSLAHLLALFPVVDCDFDKPSYHANGTGQVFTAAAMRRFFELYAPQSLWNDPRISVVNHPNLAALPEVTVLSCGCDLLHDDSMALLAALAAAGVGHKHLEYPTAPHAFLRHYRQSDLAREALGEVAQVIKSALGKAAREAL